MSKTVTFADLDLRLKKLEDDVEALLLREAEHRTFVRRTLRREEQIVATVLEGIRELKEVLK